MNTNKENTDSSSITEECQDTHDKSKNKTQKAIWEVSNTEKETFHTVVVNYQFGNKRSNTIINQNKRDTWSQLIAAVNSKKKLSEDNEENIYNLRSLYQMSKDELHNNKSSNSLPIRCKKTISKDGSQQSIQLAFYNIPLQDNYKDKNILTTSKTMCNKTLNSSISNSDNQKQDKEIKNSTHNIEVEILNISKIQSNDDIPILNDISSHNTGEILLLTNNDENLKNEMFESKTKLNENKIKTTIYTAEVPIPTVTKVLQKLAEAAQTTSELCSTVSKSTQKPESRAEVRTQTCASPHIRRRIQIQSESALLKRSSKTAGTSSTVKQRQIELHRLRLQVEQKRLHLLDMKLKREEEEILRDRILFEQDLQKQHLHFYNLDNEKDV